MPSTDSLLGTVLDGKYSVDRLLGRGGMGEVYAGTHEALGRAVAIKILHSGLTVNQSFVARFEREARMTAMLEHPNAVTIHDFGTLPDGSRYLVMEFIEGVTLREILRANVSLAPGVAVDLVCQAAGAVAEAHALGIVHRDLKPENMMVRRDEGKLFLKVVDFGLAKVLAHNATLLTNASEIMGTPRYMAPEQFQGMPVDGRADVYALGCVLFELLTGGTPFEGTILEIVGQHVHAAIPLVSSKTDGIPAAIEIAIHRALAKVPDSRTGSAEAFARELERAAAGLSISSASVVIPAAAHAVVVDSLGDSDVTALPHVSADFDFEPTDASNDTSEMTFATSSIGSAIPTVTVPIPIAGRPSWPIPAALGMAGVLILSGLTWQGLRVGASPDSPTSPVPQGLRTVEPSTLSAPVSEPGSEAAPVEAPPLTGTPTKSTSPPRRTGTPATPADTPAETPADVTQNTSPDATAVTPPVTTPQKKDNRGVLPTVGAKAKAAVVGTGRGVKSLAGKIRRGISGTKPKKNDR